MAEQNQIRSDSPKCSFSISEMRGIKWTIENVSKILKRTQVFSQNFYLGPECVCCLAFSADLDDIFLHIDYISGREIELTRKLFLHDCNSKILHEERDDNIISLQKGSWLNLIRKIKDRKSFDALINDTVIIDLFISIKEAMTQEINPLKCLASPENPVNADVFLQVGDELVPAQWSILCSRSAYFRRMFDSRMRESAQNSVKITDLSPGTVKKLILFLYTAEFDKGNNLQELLDLYYAADKYEVLDLRTLCASKIISNLTTDNAGEILHLSYRHKDSALKEEVLGYIQSHPDAVFQTEGWKRFEKRVPDIAFIITHLCLWRKSNNSVS